MNKIAIALLAISLGGCAQLQKLESLATTTISQDQVDEARNSYDAVVLAPLHRYALLPRCRASQTFLVNNCHDAAWLKQMRNVDQTVGRDFDAVQSAMVAGNVSAIQTAWAILTDAVSTAKSQMSQKGVK